MDKETEITQLTYNGRDGAHLTGIPARDLEPADIEQLTTQQLEICLTSGLYIPATDETAQENNNE